MWPDDASGETPAPPADPDATRLMASIRDGDRHAIDARLRAGARVARSRGANGSTPLMAAALYGDAALVKRLLAGGADPNAANSAGATALMWAAPDGTRCGVLLDAGADVNARSDDRRSPLIITAASSAPAPALTTAARLRRRSVAVASDRPVAAARSGARGRRGDVPAAAADYGAA